MCCRQAGNVVHADVMMNPDGTSKGWGVVQYASAQDALHAIQVTPSVVDGKPHATPPPPPPPTPTPPPPPHPHPPPPHPQKKVLRRVVWQQR
jgi:hypothetical protein